MSHSDSRKRYREIAVVLAHYGFEWLWSEWGVGRVLGAFDHGGTRGDPNSAQPTRVRMALEDLGTTFIKMGQMVSTRSDLVPTEYIEELSKLQDQAPQVSTAEILAVIEAEFGAPATELFATFDTEARAAGSIAQVHSAVLHDGTNVVVKVRRPGIEVQVEQDLKILGQLARFVSHNTEAGRKLDLESLVDEFAYSLRNELDLTREGQNAERIAAGFADDSSLHTPTIFWDYSSHAVLTMEDVRGIKIDDLGSLDQAGIDRKALAERCAHIALVQVLEQGFFHADPHPGNFFVFPDGTIALIDYGMVGRLDDRMRKSLVRLALAVSRSDSERLIEELIAMGAARHRVNRQELRRDLDHMFSRYEGLAIGDLSASAVFRDITVTAQKHSLRLPTDLVLVVRVIAMDEGLGVRLDPSFDLLEFAKPYFKRFWKRSHSVKAMTRRLRDGVIDLADVGVDLPRRVSRVVGLIERGEISVTARIEEQHSMFKHIERAANRVAVSILTAALVVGLSVLTVSLHPSGFELFLVRSLLVAAVGCGIWLLVSLWTSTR